MTKVRLDRYRKEPRQRGRGCLIEAAWMLAQALFVSSFLPFNQPRIFLLRLFGGNIGEGVVIKPRVRVKFPWKLDIGDHSWIGESVWIDNLAQVSIGAHCCLSQGAYLCTGSHNWSSDKFDLMLDPIVVKENAWIAAYAKLGPGVSVNEGAVLGFGSVATEDLESWTIYKGDPAVALKKRVVHS